MSQPNIIIEKLNDVYLKIYCEPSIQAELSEYFTFLVPGHLYMPKFKNKMWDGSIKLFSLKNHTLYLGLCEELYKFAYNRNYEIIWKKDPVDWEKFTIEDATKFYGREPLYSHGKQITVRDYQCDALSQAISIRRCILVSPTASGKSLIIYGMIRWFLENCDGKILLITPGTGLVDQMYGDFIDYSTLNHWNVEKYCHKIYSGKEKITDKRVIISTWQSLYKNSPEYFNNFRMSIFDECHLAQAQSLKGILENLTNCPYKIGTTGTLQEAKTHKLVLQGLFGPIYQVTTTKELMDRKVISDLEITCLLLRYDEKLSRDLHSMTYDQEMDFLETWEKRNKFIRNLTISLKGNTLLLFRKIDHGKLLYNIIKEKVGDTRNVYLVYGKTDVEDREAVRSIVETQRSAIIVGSYGTLSTGTDIQNLHNTIFGSPYKSKIKNLQSIGRGLRKNEIKLVSNLYDMGDDLSYTTKKGNIKRNHALNHFIYRVSLYNSERFKFRTVKINI